MALRLINALIAFLAGIIGFGILFLIFEFVARVIGLSILDCSPFLSRHLIQALFNGCYEELGKFLSIRSWKIENPDGFFLGLGWGGMEGLIRHLKGEEMALVHSTPSTMLHIVTATIICYFIKTKKPIWGLLTAILVHTGYNLILAEAE